MARTLVLFLLAFSAGAAIVVQQALNASVRTALNSAAWAGFASYAVGLACMAAFILAMRDPAPSLVLAGRIPWWTWAGGMFGAIYIALAIVLLPEIGAATFVALLVAGQMATSLAFDHFGVLGLAQRSVDPVRLIEVALVIAGVALIRR
ncbi:DMT family transporter [Methylopila sp. M107]|uniref:DMT family transporter n=1 Tax=Methylopila sp. M107 TaxID=1101190 RepID=UPI00037FBA85|nr:DMT family transporter [Methylopila sp. M107]